MSFTEGYSDTTKQTFSFKALINTPPPPPEILTADSKYPQVLCWNNFADKALAACGRGGRPLQRRRCGGDVRYLSAPSTGAWGKCPVHRRLPLQPWKPALKDFFGGLDQPVSLLSCWGELRYLARDITLLPSSPTSLSRRLHPSCRRGAEIAFQPFKRWDYEAKDLQWPSSQTTTSCGCQFFWLSSNCCA